MSLPQGSQRILTSATISGLISFHAYYRRKLTPSASVVAFAVGLWVGCSGVVSDAALFSFFFTASRATKYGAEKKKKLTSTEDADDGSYDSDGYRNVSQVLTNSFGALLVIILDAHWRNAAYVNSTYMPMNEGEKLANFISEIYCFPATRPARFAIVAQFAACAGDTLSSELGILSKSKPRFILNPTKVVPPGTNGGVTVNGFLAAALGGLIVGCSAAIAEKIASSVFGIDQSVEVELGAKYLIGGSVFASLCGTTLDSILGATLQYTGARRRKANRTSNNNNTTEEEEDLIVLEHHEKDDVHISGIDILSNDHVNLLSSTLTTMLCFWWAAK